MKIREGFKKCVIIGKYWIGGQHCSASKKGYLQLAYCQLFFVTKRIYDGIVTFRCDGNKGEDRSTFCNPGQESISEDA